jgi:hypothetical protein
VKKVPPKPVKKDVKSLMKGVMVKKKPKAGDMKPATGAKTAGTESRAVGKREADGNGEQAEGEKRQKLDP